MGHSPAQFQRCTQIIQQMHKGCLHCDGHGGTVLGATVNKSDKNPCPLELTVYQVYLVAFLIFTWALPSCHSDFTLNNTLDRGLP